MSSKNKVGLLGPQKRRESYVNIPCKITKSKCQTLRVEPQPRALEGKEVLRIVGPDLVRDLVVPHHKPNIYPGVVELGEFDRLKKQAKIVTLADRKRALEESEKMKNQKMQESLCRKEEIKKYDKRRVKGARLNDLELEARNRADHLLARAVELRQEQEDEVKRANQLIMGTKCHAIRDAQVAEKKLMKEELEEEERRLDRMMEDERRKGLQSEEKKQEERRIRNGIYVKEVLEQVRENEIEKLLGAEQVEEEAKRMKRAMIEIQLEEVLALKQKADNQAKTREDLRNVNDQLRYFQDLERAEARVAELKIQEFMREKAEREDARDAEISLVKTAKEREIARLRALQQRAQDTQAEMDSLNAQRVTDEVERQWREKERAEARKKAGAEEALKEARLNQVFDRQRMQALEIAREKRQFESIISVQQKQAELEKNKEFTRAAKMDAHREAILKQINEKEYERIKKRKELFEEGVAIKLEEERRTLELERALRRKVTELKANKVPDHYICEIERQLKMGSTGTCGDGDKNTNIQPVQIQQETPTIKTEPESVTKSSDVVKEGMVIRLEAIQSGAKLDRDMICKDKNKDEANRSGTKHKRVECAPIGPRS